MTLDVTLVRGLVFDKMRDAVLIVDRDGRIVDRNPAGEALLAATEDGGVGRDEHVDRYPAVAPLARARVADGGDGPEVEVGERTFGSQLIPLFDENGEPLGRAIVLRDVTRRARSEGLLRALATTDELTRIPNRRQFLDLARRTVALARRSGRPIAWLMFDIDDFKSVNGEYGHPIGDLVLQSVAAIASASVRAGDVLGRVGGEEFALCLPDTTPGGARKVAERLRASVADLRVAVPGDYVEVTVSIGVAVAEGAEADVQTSMARAEEAQERAKRSGGDRVEFDDPAENV